jgi:hypothetical protein
VSPDPSSTDLTIRIISCNLSIVFSSNPNPAPGSCSADAVRALEDGNRMTMPSVGDPCEVLLDALHNSKVSSIHFLESLNYMFLSNSRRGKGAIVTMCKSIDLCLSNQQPGNGLQFAIHLRSINLRSSATPFALPKSEPSCLASLWHWQISTRQHQAPVFTLVAPVLLQGQREP